MNYVKPVKVDKLNKFCEKVFAVDVPGRRLGRVNANIDFRGLEFINCLNYVVDKKIVMANGNGEFTDLIMRSFDKAKFSVFAKVLKVTCNEKKFRVIQLYSKKDPFLELYWKEFYTTAAVTEREIVAKA